MKLNTLLNTQHTQVSFRLVLKSQTVLTVIHGQPFKIQIITVLMVQIVLFLVDFFVGFFFFVDLKPQFIFIF